MDLRGGGSGAYLNLICKYRIDVTDVTSASLFGFMEELDAGLGYAGDAKRWVETSDCGWAYGEAPDAEGYIEEYYYGPSAPIAALNVPIIVIGLMSDYNEPWQALNCALDGSLWYQHYEISLLTEVNDSKISIIKDYQDQNGNDINKTIKFSLNVDNSDTVINYGTENIYVNAADKEAKDSEVYYYQNKDGLGFTLTEESGYTIEGVKSTDAMGNPVAVSFSGNTITGTMPQNELQLHITNNKEPEPDEGKLRLVKEVTIPEIYPNDSKSYSSQNGNFDNNKVDDNENYYTNNEVFPFVVKLTPGNKSSFKYNGKTYVDPQIEEQYRKKHPGETIVAGSYEFITTVKAHIAGNELTNDQIREITGITWWKDTKQPRYDIREITENDLKAENISYLQGLDGWDQISDPEMFKKIKKNIECTDFIEIDPDSGVIYSKSKSVERGEDDETYNRIVTVTAKNKQKTQKGKIKIIKVLDTTPYSNIGMTPEEIEETINDKIENKTLEFKFKIKIGNDDEFTITLGGEGGYRKEGNNYIFEWVSNDYFWLKGNELEYTVTEIVESEFDEAPTNNNTISGIFENEETVLVKNISDEYSFENRPSGTPVPKVFIIHILKRMDEKTNELLKDKELHFVVNLDGKFAYGNLKSYKRSKSRLTYTAENGNGILGLSEVPNSTELSIENGENIPERNQYITLDVHENQYVYEWTSEPIAYLPEDADDLKIMIYEDTSNFDSKIKSDLVKGIVEGKWEKVKNLKELEDSPITGLPTLEVEYENYCDVDSDYLYGFLRINKKMTGSSSLEKEELEKLEFKFRVIVERYNRDTREWKRLRNTYVTLDKDNFNGSEWNWVDDSAVGWDPEKHNAPIYLVQEIMPNENTKIKFTGINVGGTYETVDMNNPSDKYRKWFRGLDGSGSTFMFEDLQGFQNEIAHTSCVCLEKYAVVGTIKERGKSEAFVDESEDIVEVIGIKPTQYGTDKTDDTTDVYFTNDYGTIWNSGSIKAYKETTSAKYENKEYAILIKVVSGTFKLDGNEEITVPEGSTDGYYLTRNNTLVSRDQLFIDGHLNPDVAITFKVPNGRNVSEAVWESALFKWKETDNPPRIAVEKREYMRDLNTDTVNTLFTEVDPGEYTIRLTNGGEELGGSTGEIQGDISNNCEVNIVNGDTDPEEIHVRVQKKYYPSGNPDDDYLKSLKFGFKVNFVNHGESYPVAKYKENGTEAGGRKYYLYEADEITICTKAGEEVRYEIMETDIPNGIVFKEFLVDGVVHREKPVTGTLMSGARSIVNVQAINEPGTDKFATMRLTKQNKDSEGNPYKTTEDYSFIAKIIPPSGASGVYGKYVKGNDIVELSSGREYYFNYRDGEETLSESASNRIIVSTHNTASATWNSKGIIYWYTDNAPRYEIIESGGSPNYTTEGSQKGSLNDGDESGVVFNVIDNKPPTGDKVYLRIKKNYTNTSSHSKEFKFRIDVEGHVSEYETITIPAGHVDNADNDDDGIAGNVHEYELPEGHTSLDYTVTEVGLPDGSDFEYIYEKLPNGVDPNSIDKEKYIVRDSTRKISGTMTKEKNNSSASAVTVLCKNSEDGDTYGDASLHIQKKGVKKGVYRFKVNIHAKNALTIKDGRIGFDCLDVDESKSYEILVKAGEDVLVGNFSWSGSSEGGPSYSVEEVTDNEGKVIIGEDIDASGNTDEKYTGKATKASITNQAGEMKKGSNISVIQKNEPVMTGGYIRVTKTIKDKKKVYDPDKEYHFNVVVYRVKDESKISRENDNYEIIDSYYDQTVKIGEIWTSKYVEWEAWNEAPRYYIEELDEEEGSWEIKSPGRNEVMEGRRYRVGMLEEEILPGEVFSTRAPHAEKKSRINDMRSLEETKRIEGEEPSKENQAVTTEKQINDKTYDTNKADTSEVDEIVNDIKEVKGSFRVIKKVATNKAGVPDSPFKVKIKIVGNFRFEGEEETRTSWESPGEITLHHNESWPTDGYKTLFWAKDAEAPKVYVEETNIAELNKQEDIRGTWQLAGISNNGSNLKEYEKTEICINNEFEGPGVELLYEIGGNVWIDDYDKDNKNSEPNGLMDGEEKGVEKVEVYVYRASSNTLLDIYTPTGGVIQQPILTDKTGRWDAAIKLDSLDDLAANKFYVAYVYDGQTYEPTKELVSGSATAFMSAGTTGRDKWHKDSHAKDVPTSSGSGIFNKYNRKTANEKMAYIEGNKPMDGSGYTLGKAISKDKANTYDLHYKANVATEPDRANGSIIKRAQSKIITLNDDRTVRDEFKVVATTKQVGLTFPFDSQLTLLSRDATIGPQLYMAGYEYSKHINLGIKERRPADMLAVKELKEAIVVVNGRKLTYGFGRLDRVVNGGTNSIRVDYKNENNSSYNQEKASSLYYVLGLFKTDYYYRAELYRTGVNYDKLYNFYKNLNPGLNTDIEDTEIEVFLTYKYLLHNNSETYDTIIYSIDDYAEASQELVTKDVYRYIKTKDGRENTSGNKLEKIIDIEKNTQNTLVPCNNNGNRTSISPNILASTKDNPINPIYYSKSSDGLSYNKLTFVLNGEKGERLTSGQTNEYYATYRLEKTTIDGVADSLLMGTKTNIVEIAKYSTLKKGTNEYEGKIDRNSAPSNVNIRDYNTEGRYEDDTYIVRTKLGFVGSEYKKTIEGRAWEDKKLNGQSNGNGLYDGDSDEALIGGLTTDLVEKVQIPDDSGSGYTEYDFLWPTSKRYEMFGGMTFEELTGFSSMTETSRENGKAGSYKFSNIPSGNYVVRFEYGNDKIDQTGSLLNESEGNEAYYRKTGEAMAINMAGQQWSTLHGNRAGVYTANYYNKRYGQTPAIYNGQDYKATIYQAGTNALDGEFYSPGRNAETDSNARDNEARRLEVMSNSEIITNSNAEDMYEANKATGNHHVIHNEYSMFADSAKIRVLNYEKEDIPEDEEEGMYRYEEQPNSQVKIIKYEDVTQYVDIGLIERPENKVTLDKEISTIRLTTNDEKLLFNAVYDLNYVEKANLTDEERATKTIVAKYKVGGRDRFLIADNVLNTDKSTGTELMQSLDKVENKLEYNDETRGGIQNFRFINIDNDILQGMNVEITYKLVAINSGEADYTHQNVEINSGNKYASELLLMYANAIKDDNANSRYTKAEVDGPTTKRLTFGNYGGLSVNGISGLGIGEFYYTGRVSATDRPVSTRIRQILDYVDNDAVFETNSNKKKDHYWRNATVSELDGNGTMGKRLINMLTSNEMYILDKDERKYTTDTQNNLALSIDIVTDTGDNRENIHDNGGFEMKLLPITYERGRVTDGDKIRLNTVIDNDDGNIVPMDAPAGEKRQIDNSSPNWYKVASVMDITILKRTASDDDADSMAYDNLAEIVRYENSVGRRDMTVVPGDTKPILGEFITSLDERDSSAPEIITFTPPTGTFYRNIINNQLIIAVVAGLGIIVLGIIVIKKKVVDKKQIK